jgi:hypothetical protein
MIGVALRCAGDAFTRLIDVNDAVIVLPIASTRMRTVDRPSMGCFDVFSRGVDHLRDGMSSARSRVPSASQRSCHVGRLGVGVARQQALQALQSAFPRVRSVAPP